MIEKFDYAEPACPLCGGKDFYNPNKGGPQGSIPISRIIDKVDGLLDKNDYAQAGRLLVSWRDEAIALQDKRGELSMESELVGYYRKQNDRERGLASVERALSLIEELSQGELASGATIFINCATAYKAFGLTEKALPLYRRAEQVYRKHLSPEDERLGGLYNNMALALVDLSRYDEAEEAYRASLGVMAHAPQGEAECAITYVNLAHMYETWGKRDQIEGCMRMAYALLQSDTLPHNGYYAFVLEKCAPSFGYFGDVAAYEQLKQEAERIYEGT